MPGKYWLISKIANRAGCLFFPLLFNGSPTVAVKSNKDIEIGKGNLLKTLWELSGFFKIKNHMLLVLDNTNEQTEIKSFPDTICNDIQILES